MSKNKNLPEVTIPGQNLSDEEKKILAESFDLNYHCARLLADEPFFAALSRHIHKRADFSIPTAGVCLNVGHQSFELLYNPVFMASLSSDAQRQAVLKHEYYHLILDHVTTRKPEGPQFFKLWNIATDLAINSHLKDLPEFCCFPGRGPFCDFPEALAAEQYFQRLLQKQQPQQGESGEGQDGDGRGGSGGQGQFDSHEGWVSAGAGDGSGGEKTEADAQRSQAAQVAKEKLREKVRGAVNEAASRGWGTVSENMKKDILDRLNPTVDWRKVLRYFVKVSQKAHKSNSIRKINKRYPYIHAGKKQNRQAKIAISIDQSGSVDDFLLVAFFTELDKLAEFADFTVIPFDHAVAEDKVYVWKRKTRHACERVLCGGTDFNAPTDYVNEHGFDGHIILTDLCAPKPKPSKCQRLWMSDKQNAANPYFQTNEQVIAIDVLRK